MSVSKVRTIRLPEKQPGETLSYVIDMSEHIPSTETITSLAFAIYDADDDPVTFTDLQSIMLLTKAFNATTRQIEAQITQGENGKTYVLRGRVSCASNNRYEIDGVFKVKEVG